VQRNPAIAALIASLAALAAAMGWNVWEGELFRAAPEKSVAVLPFENLSRDPNNAYFADGMQDEIRSNLARVADLKVIGRTSVMQYKNGVPHDLREIGRQLGVANVLEGSVRRVGNRVRVSAHLADTRTHRELWAQTYDRELADVFAIQSEIAKGIAASLQAKLTGREEQALAGRPTNNPEAYDAYLRGLAYTLKPAITVANTVGAQKHLREAVALDSRFALCWALLSYVDAMSYLSSFNLESTDALREEARQAAETALTLQPDLDEAMLAKGYYHYAFLKDYDTAVSYFERARPLLPNSSSIPAALAYVARRQGQWDRSDAYFNEAERLDPRNVFLLTQHALSDIARRNFSLALRKLDYILDIAPGDVDTLALKAGVAQAEGDLQRASGILDGLHPTADQSGALETQVYQAILKRQPAPMIRRLTEILATPDQLFGYINGELYFWLGWAQKVAGDNAAAQQSWRKARSELELFLNKQPENLAIIGDLTLTNMGLGDQSAALTLSERAAATFSIEKDAINGSAVFELVARCAALRGDHDHAIAALQKLLSLPHAGALTSGVPLTSALLRLDPMFDPLRDDPRFQKICEQKQP
jgi:TolB-like protein